MSRGQPAVSCQMKGGSRFNVRARRSRPSSPAPFTLVLFARRIRMKKCVVVFTGSLIIEER